MSPPRWRYGSHVTGILQTESQLHEIHGEVMRVFHVEQEPLKWVLHKQPTLSEYGHNNPC